MKQNKYRVYISFIGVILFTLVLYAGTVFVLNANWVTKLIYDNERDATVVKKEKATDLENVEQENNKYYSGDYSKYQRSWNVNLRGEGKEASYISTPLTQERASSVTGSDIELNVNKTKVTATKRRKVRSLSKVGQHDATYYEESPSSAVINQYRVSAEEVDYFIEQSHHVDQVSSTVKLKTISSGESRVSERSASDIGQADD